MANSREAFKISSAVNNQTNPEAEGRYNADQINQLNWSLIREIIARNITAGSSAMLVKPAGSRFAHRCPILGPLFS